MGGKWRDRVASDPEKNPVVRLSRDLRDASRLYLAQGAALILVGLLILVFPELLSVLVAVYLVLAGLATLIVGWRLRKARRAFDELGRIFLD